MAALSPRHVHNRNRSRGKILLTIAIVFVAVGTAMWSGLARRGSSDIGLSDFDRAIADALKEQDDPFAVPPGTARPDATSRASHDSKTSAVGQLASSATADDQVRLAVPGAVTSSTTTINPQSPAPAPNGDQASTFPSSGPLSTSPSPGGGGASGSSSGGGYGGGGGIGGGGGGG